MHLERLQVSLERKQQAYENDPKISVPSFMTASSSMAPEVAKTYVDLETSAMLRSTLIAGKAAATSQIGLTSVSGFRRHWLFRCALHFCVCIFSSHLLLAYGALFLL